MSHLVHQRYLLLRGMIIGWTTVIHGSEFGTLVAKILHVFDLIWSLIA